VQAALPRIRREELQERIARGDGVVVVDALSPISYARSRLPGAVNLPPDSVDDWAPRRLRDRDAEIVVYCRDVDCDSSVLVGRRLVELGYRNVRHYAEGKDDWVAAGLPLERGHA
jgi:rhodanese-related sulfurtransferase